MAYLRHATKERHRALESSLNLLRPDVTRADYVEILQSFYGFWQPWEQKIERALGPELASFFAARQHVPALRSDLAHLGFSPENTTYFPRAPRLPELPSLDAALGSMYVSEGSTLGGQILSRHFIEKCNVDPNECAFFSGYGQETGSMWKQFGIEMAKRPECALPAMAEAANQTFDCLREWLWR